MRFVNFKINAIGWPRYLAVMVFLGFIYGVGISTVGIIIFAPLFLLLLSVLMMHHARALPSLFLLVLINSYFNYSIIIGEYIGLPWLGVGNVYEKSEILYEKMINIIVIFNIGFYSIVCGINQGKIQAKSTRGRVQPIIVYVCVLILILIVIFGVDRSASLAYSVKISPAFEYSSLLILVGLYFSGVDKKLNLTIYIISILIIIEDLRHGGRITSLRILLTIYLMAGEAFVTNKKTLSFFIVGVALMTLMGASRGFVAVDLTSVLLGFFANLFVFDTVVFSYYASIMHLELYEVVDYIFIIQSFVSALNQVLLFGIIPDGDFFQLSGQASERGFQSLGGGVAPSFLYFWLGYAGVLIFGIMTGVIYRNMLISKNVNVLYFIASVAAFPRWFLYGPWIFPKTIYLIFIFFILFGVLIRLRK